jgi:hypothetical protein
MPGKMARSTLDHRSGCPLRWWPSSPRACLAGRPEIRECSRSLGVIRGIPVDRATGPSLQSGTPWMMPSLSEVVRQVPQSVPRWPPGA